MTTLCRPKIKTLESRRFTATGDKEDLVATKVAPLTEITAVRENKATSEGGGRGAMVGAAQYTPQRFFFFDAARDLYFTPHRQGTRGDLHSLFSGGSLYA